MRSCSRCRRPITSAERRRTASIPRASAGSVEEAATPEATQRSEPARTSIASSSTSRSTTISTRITRSAAVILSSGTTPRRLCPTGPTALPEISSEDRISFRPTLRPPLARTLSMKPALECATTRPTDAGPSKPAMPMSKRSRTCCREARILESRGTPAPFIPLWWVLPGPLQGFSDLQECTISAVRTRCSASAVPTTAIRVFSIAMPIR